MNIQSFHQENELLSFYPWFFKKGEKVSGVYFLCADTELIYIGSSSDIRRRVMSHLCLSGGQLTIFYKKRINNVFFIPISEHFLYHWLESEAIASFLPPANKAPMSLYKTSKPKQTYLTEEKLNSCVESLTLKVLGFIDDYSKHIDKYFEQGFDFYFLSFKASLDIYKQDHTFTVLLYHNRIIESYSCLAVFTKQYKNQEFFWLKRKNDFVKFCEKKIKFLLRRYSDKDRAFLSYFFRSPYLQFHFLSFYHQYTEKEKIFSRIAEVLEKSA